MATRKLARVLKCTYLVTMYSHQLLQQQPPQLPQLYQTSSSTKQASFWNSSCHYSIGVFPNKVSGATGMLFENKYSLICGGYNGAWTLQCFAPGQEYAKIEMLTARQFAANILLNQTHALVAGGYSPGSTKANTEIISLNQPPVYGPVLPYPLSGHCIHKLNSSMGILAGGSNNGGRFKNVLFFNIDTLEWTTGPQFKVTRSWHSCGSYRDSFDNLYFVVAGGITSYDITGSVEILSLSDLTWTNGPGLPMPLDSFEMVQAPDGKGVVVIGGYGNGSIQNRIYHLACTDGISGCQWTTMTQKLSVPRDHLVAMPIPRELAICNY